MEKTNQEEKITLTNELIEQGKSNEGGWTRRQLELLGVSWPLKKGWKETLITKRIDRKKFDEFIQLKGITVSKLRKQKKLEKKESRKKLDKLQLDLDLF